MNAEDARKITNKSLKGLVIEPLLEKIYRRVKESAEVGKHVLRSPFDINGEPYLSAEIRAALTTSLRSCGYKVLYHEDPDPGHPCSSKYETLEW